jgi:hypothetical protein
LTSASCWKTRLERATEAATVDAHHVGGLRRAGSANLADLLGRCRPRSAGRALALLEPELKRAPNDCSPLTMRAWAVEQQGDLRAAVRPYERAVAVTGDQVAACSAEHGFAGEKLRQLRARLTR